ncbi:MAG: RagB/SusD family nutrient uptake outer membrane protein, partial [Parabacteroides sp.]|nr:RagB/SusD family nutrient uptake outer membrane protein [Parabacteroides sp.]
MKNIFLIALSGMLLISSVSCDDFLTETPTVSIPDDQAFVTSQDYNNALTGLYQTLGRYTFLGRDVQAVGDASTDIAAHTATTSHFYNIFKYQILDTNPYLNDIWSTGYYAIDRASRIIAASEEAQSFTESDAVVVNGCVAQAYAIRALSSFYLVNYFGLPYSAQNKATLGIVNITKPVAAFETVSRSTV